MQAGCCVSALPALFSINGCRDPFFVFSVSLGAGDKPAKATRAKSAGKADFVRFWALRALAVMTAIHTDHLKNYF